MNRLKLLACAGLTALALSACTGDKNLAAKDPVTAAKDLSVAFRTNDFDRLTHIMAPPEDYAKLEARYKDKQAKTPAPTDEESKQFADQLAEYTAPDAEAKLFAQVQPKLAQMGPQIPMGVAMMSGIMGQSIEQNPKLTPTEKDQAKAVLTAITKWATTAKLDDPDKAKQAIGVIVATARSLKLTTLADAQKLSFAQVMDKAGTGIGGVRKALAVYGFDTDKMLDSVSVAKKSQDGDKAVVTVSYTIMDTPVTFDLDMVRRDGRWYSADLLKTVEDSLSDKPAAPTGIAPAAAAPAEAAPAEAAPAAAPEQTQPAPEAAQPPAEAAPAPSAASDASGNTGA